VKKITNSEKASENDVFGLNLLPGRAGRQRAEVGLLRGIARGEPMADKKKMSVAEILAAARAQTGGESPPAAELAAAAEPVAESAVAAEPAVAAEQPAATKPAAAKPAAGGRPSVAEIMKLARGKGGGAPAEKPAAKPAAEKPAAKPAAAKPVAAKAAAPKAAVIRDTASILAAARAGAKPGPVSKAEAPARPEPRPKPAAEHAAKPATPVAAKAVPPKPVKPVVKKAAEEEEDRRGFLEMALGSFMAMGFTALSVTGGLFTLGLARYMFPNVLAEPPSRFKVGFKEGFPSGKVETKYVAQYGVWVVNSEFQGQQQIYALKTVCTHLGCTPNWLEAEQKFKCPCHGSGFYKDGVNFEGPAPRPLERYAIRVSDDGQLEVDKSRTFQEELGQWADPESYITV
jgi:cytochrome b6-f complex iron-sulfur subunit